MALGLFRQRQEAAPLLLGLGVTKDCDRCCPLTAFVHLGLIHLQVDGAAIELAEGDVMIYRSVAGLAEGQLGLRLGLESSLSGLCVRSGMMLESPDTQTDPRVDREACQRMGLRSMLVVPLRHHDSCIGVLKAMARQPNRFGSPERMVLGLLSDAIAAAMFFATKVSKSDLFHLATHDPLTDLANHPLLMERLRTIVKAHEPAQGRVALLRIDLNDLASVNATYGYPAGDALLQECASRLVMALGDRWLVARLEGAAFATILPNLQDPEQIENGLAAIRAAMEKPMALGWFQLPLSLSIGCALFPDDGSAIEAILKLAEERMTVCGGSRASAESTTPQTSPADQQAPVHP